MKIKFLYLLFFLSYVSNSQTINLNQNHIINYLRISQLNGDLKSDYSFNLKPFEMKQNSSEIDTIIFDFNEYAPKIYSFLNKKGEVRILPVDYNFEFNSHHPHNRNNGSMIPNRGYQHIISPGFFLKIGPVSIQLKPEFLFSENRDFQGFGEGPNGHSLTVWNQRYHLWNHLDIPERFGEESISELLIGQSNIKINYKKLSIGFSNENIWWGPSIRNSIMMSNHARGFKHISFNTIEPIRTIIGNFEWQLISGRLESSGFNPPNTDLEFQGNKIFVPKINQLGETDDWRYLQGLLVSYSPRWIDGLSLGFIRWVQMYSAVVEGRYSYFMDGDPTWFPVFSNLFRKNDKNGDLERQTNQAAGLFFKWLWKKSKAEIYAEFHHNDSKFNFRDLLLDSDHSRAFTIGMQKVFELNDNNFLFSWEWTKLEQTNSKFLRNAGSWYEHIFTYDGYTNKGEVLGASIGPGSNSQFFAINRIKKEEKIGIAFEIINHDNDFYLNTFNQNNSLKRNWEDYNYHLNFSKKFNKFWVSSNLIYSKSFNYQWDYDSQLTNFKNGNNVDNLHLSVKLNYFFNN